VLTRRERRRFCAYREGSIERVTFEVEKFDEPVGEAGEAS
jgi:hypothetical protein